MRKVDLSSKETRVLDDKFRHHARDTCVCAISKLESTINNEDAEKYFVFTFENILEPDPKNQAKAIADGLDYQKFKTTEQTVAQVVRQCS
ncbi:hypothetical protein [Brucella gallinifaecis]|uniref:hypothetical protein n=1 Tax=Brucella gallinifaecis TaxID=215590 RepID=UPI002362E505|nr:hypothetical protein [Brucella gallinifaecis]